MSDPQAGEVWERAGERRTIENVVHLSDGYIVQCYTNQGTWQLNQRTWQRWASKATLVEPKE